jgi:nitroreductase
VITMRRDLGGVADGPSAPAEARACPDPLAAAEVIRSVVAEAVWAPSVHNTQPWCFTADGPRLRLYADVGRQLTAADPEGREMMISCGAALFTARLALRSLGYVPETQVLPDPADPTLVAQLSWPRRAAVTEYERRLFSQVRRRRTHRGGFDPVPLSPALLAALREGAARDGATLRIVADDGRRAMLAAAVETAERALRLDSDRVQELVAWSAPPGSPRRDGVPATSYPARPERTDPDFPGRDFAHGRGWGLPRLSTALSFRTAGVAALLTTPDDRAADWVRAGQALQRILLAAGTCGVAAALHSQPLEFGWLREFVRTRLSAGGYPQLVLRLGTVIQIATSVRRPPADVLLSPGAPVGPPPSPA